MKHRDLLKLALLPLAATSVVETAAYAEDATTTANKYLLTDNNLL